MSLKIALLGFGEVGQTLAAELVTRASEVRAWDPKFEDERNEATRAAARIGVLVAPDAAGAARDAGLIISAVTAARIEVAARSVAGHLAPDAWYFDLNSTSPSSKAAAGEVVQRAGGRFVEAAIMSPISPRGAASPMLIGGAHAAGFQSLASQLGFTHTRIMPGKLGAASAAKMCRSVLVKGLEALVLESLLSARRHGVDEVVLESLQGLKFDDWRESARYMASRALLHGARRAEEMREVTRTVGEAGLMAPMSSACVMWQDWAAAHPELHAAALPQLLDGLLDGMLAARTGDSR
ncbi:MAG: NAD(P)-dependent oxidoreductase [Steroidobacteraceae bacterium]|jgi:3-hydroxyisobutyrate dehydrogenase-like beta-hydroxyacid dehydrogenase|nr:NAD(P)-dependent oxidoreductase [Steroidobacteraceae bacterium]